MCQTSRRAALHEVKMPPRAPTDLFTDDEAQSGVSQLAANLCCRLASIARALTHPTGLLAVVVSLAGCGAQPAPLPQPAGNESVDEVPWFEDVTDAWQIDFVQQPGPIAGYPMQQINGTGVALFDCDGDDRLDLYFLQGAGPDSQHRNQLFLQRESGGFEDISAGSGLDIAEFCTGVATGDINNDGLPEVLVNFYKGSRLFLNRGSGKLQDITAESGIENSHWATSATFFDYDRDGWLDLFIGNYVVDEPRQCDNPAGQPDYCPPFLFAGSRGKLFHNQGGAEGECPQFEDVSQAAGITAPGPALGVLAADFTGDGWTDLLVANDAQPNRLWVNQQDGTFLDEAVQRGVAVSQRGKPEGNMGIAYSDADGDGMPDLFITHLDRELHTLWRQHPRGTFGDVTGPAKIAAADMRGTGFGTIMEDFDDDGDADVAIANGRVVKGDGANQSELGEHFSLYAERNHLFANDGSGTFSNISASNSAFCATPGVWRGLACGDIDRDGGLDLVVTQIGGKARVLRNVGKQGHWLGVRAFDPALKRDAFGAEVTARVGDKQWIRRIQSDGSYQSAGSPLAHFGLGERTKVDAIEILWPDGSRESFSGIDADQYIVCKKGTGQ